MKMDYIKQLSFAWGSLENLNELKGVMIVDFLFV